MFFDSLRNLLASFPPSSRRNHHGPRRKQSGRFRPRVECLEDRNLLSLVTYTFHTDSGDPLSCSFSVDSSVIKTGFIRLDSQDIRSFSVTTPSGVAYTGFDTLPAIAVDTTTGAFTSFFGAVGFQNGLYTKFVVADTNFNYSKIGGEGWLESVGSAIIFRGTGHWGIATQGSPTLTGLSFNSADEGTQDLALPITGTNFSASSVVQWNGNDLPAPTFIDDSHLLATIPAADRGEEGQFDITVVNPGPGGGSSGALTFTVNDPQIIPDTKGATFSVTEGQAFTDQVVATFTDPGGSEDPSQDYSAKIYWGDNAATGYSVAKIRDDGAGHFSVLGNYTYVDEGLYNVSVTLTHDGLSSVFAVPALASVSDASLSPDPITFNPVAGAPAQLVVSFTDGNLNALIPDFGAAITWGDGTVSAGLVSYAGATKPGGFVVSATHTYAASGSYAFSVLINDEGGTTARINTTVTIADLGITVQTGQSAGGGLWNNKNGQALIDSFNGGPTSTALAEWLAVSFPNLYGVIAGANNLTGETNDQVAAFYQSLFSLHGPKLDAAVLGMALDVYATTASLGGTAAAQYGFTVTAYGLGASDYNVGPDGAAFGVTNNTTLNVYQILQAANARAVSGVLYNGDKTLRNLAFDVFAGIDSLGGL